MDKFQISILEYLGKFGQGVLVLVSIIYNKYYYEATYFYTSDQIVLTVPEELEEIIGHKITEDEEYPSIIKELLKKVVPYKEIFNRLDDIDFGRWVDKDPENIEKN